MPASQSSGSNPRSNGGLLALLICLAGAGLLAFRLLHLRDALSPDETLYLLMGRLLKEGGLPYRDLFEIHSPGLFFVVAALPARLLEWEAGVRLASVLFLTTGAGLLARFLWMSGFGLRAIGGGLALFTLLNCQDKFEAAYFETEQVMVLPLVAMLVFLSSNHPMRRAPEWAWLMWGMVALLKQTGVLFLPLLLFADLANPERLAELRRAPLSGLFRRAGAAAAPWLPVLLFFAWRGGLPEMIRQILIDALHQGGEYAAGGSWLRMDQFRQLIPLMLLALGATWQIRRRIFGPAFPWVDRASPLALGWVWLGCGLLFLKAQKMGFPHYGSILTPAILLIAAGAIEAWWPRQPVTKPEAQRWVFRTAAFLAVAALFFPLRELRGNRYPDINWEVHSIQVRDTALALRRQLPDHLIVAVDNHPGWYWYLHQPAPRQVWLGQRLDYFPAQLPEIEAELERYTRGRLTLYLINEEPWSGISERRAAFKARLIAQGARPFPLAAALAPSLTKPFISAYELDRRK